MNQLYLTTRMNYTHIPEHINSSFCLLSLHSMDKIIWYLPIKIGRYFYTMCTINRNGTFSFIACNHLIKHKPTLLNIFSESYINTIINSQLQFREFHKLLTEDVKIPIHDIFSRRQLKQYIDNYLNKKLTYFLNLDINNINFCNEQTILKQEVYYISPKIRASAEKRLQALLS